MSPDEEDGALEPKKSWERPEVRELKAGSAEDGAGNTPDSGVPS